EQPVLPIAGLGVADKEQLLALEREQHREALVVEERVQLGGGGEGGDRLRAAYDRLRPITRARGLFVRDRSGRLARLLDPLAERDGGIVLALVFRRLALR